MDIGATLNKIKTNLAKDFNKPDHRFKNLKLAVFKNSKVQQNNNGKTKSKKIIFKYNCTGCRQSPWTTLKCNISINSE